MCFPLVNFNFSVPCLVIFQGKNSIKHVHFRFRSLSHPKSGSSPTEFHYDSLFRSWENHPILPPKITIIPPKKAEPPSDSSSFGKLRKSNGWFQSCPNLKLRSSGNSPDNGWLKLGPKVKVRSWEELKPFIGTGFPEDFEVVFIFCSRFLSAFRQVTIF